MKTGAPDAVDPSTENKALSAYFQGRMTGSANFFTPSKGEGCVQPLVPARSLGERVAEGRLSGSVLVSFAPGMSRNGWEYCGGLYERVNAQRKAWIGDTSGFGASRAIVTS